MRRRFEYYIQGRDISSKTDKLLFSGLNGEINKYENFWKFYGDNEMAYTWTNAFGNMIVNFVI